VRSRNYVSFDEIAETALEEESAIVSKNERYKGAGNGLEGPKCTNCNKVDHVASRCYLKERRDTRVNHLTTRDVGRRKPQEITCYNCQGKGHMVRQCKRPKKRFERQELSRQGVSDLGSESRPSESGNRPTVRSYSVGRITKQSQELLRLTVDVSNEELLFFIDTGADISLLKAEKLTVSTEVDPRRKVKVKCVNGSPNETDGLVEAKVRLRTSSLPHKF
jgi:hypothetical protein